MNILENNYSALFRKYPLLCDKLSHVPPCGGLYELKATPSGVPSIIMRSGGKDICLHSAVDPAREAKRIIDAVEPGRYDIFIIMSPGNMQLVRELLGRIPGIRHVLVVEKDLSLFGAVLSRLDISELLLDERTRFFAGADITDICGYFESLFSVASARGVTFIKNPASEKMNREYYDALVRAVNGIIDAVSSREMTLSRFGILWLNNFIKNLPVLFDTPGAGLLKGRFSGMPAFIISAGPSLAGELAYIKEHANSACLISVDTALPALKEAGIKPDLAVTLDPNKISARHFWRQERGDSLIVLPPTSPAPIFDKFRGDTLLFNSGFPLFQELLRGAPLPPSLDASGGSVSCAALDLALFAGCTRVVFCGQDLSPSPGADYAPGTLYRLDDYERANRFFSSEGYIRKRRLGMMDVPVQGYAGELYTAHNMKRYLENLEKIISKNSQAEFFRLSPSGARISGVKQAKPAFQPGPALSAEDIISGIRKEMSSFKRPPPGLLKKNLENIKLKLERAKDDNLLRDPFIRYLLEPVYYHFLLGSGGARKDPSPGLKALEFMKKRIGENLEKSIY